MTLSIDRGQVLALVGPSAGQVDVPAGASTTRDGSAGRLYVDGDLIGYREKAGKLMRCRRDAASSAATSAWSSSISTSPAPDHAGQHHRGAGAREGRQQVVGGRAARELLEAGGFTDKADAYPAQLSGGQQQRVAIAGVGDGPR